MTDAVTNRYQDPRLLLAPLMQVAEAGVGPDPTLTAQIAANAERVLEIAPSVLYELLTPALCEKHPHTALQWLRDAGLLVFILPELDATHDFSQESGRRHKDVWDHTKTVVRQAVPRPIVRWAAALHDIGKVPTRRFLPGGKVTFHGHAEEGVRMFRRGPAKRIEFPKPVHEAIEELILHHLRPGQYDPSWTDSAVRRFRRETEPFLRDLLDLGRADITSKRPGKRQSCLRTIHALSERIDAVVAEDAKPQPLPAGLGNLLMSGLSLPPGKHLGDLRKKLQALYEAGELLGGQDAAYYLEAVLARELMADIVLRPPRGYE